MGNNSGIRIRRQPLLLVASIAIPCIALLLTLVFLWFGLVKVNNANAADAKGPLISAPLNGAVVKGDPLLSWQPFDANLVSYYVYESYYDSALTSKIFSVNVYGTSRNITGNQTIELWWRVVAVNKDGSRNVGEARHLFVDNLVPVGFLGASSPGAVVDSYSGTVNISGSIFNAEKNIATHQFDIQNPNGTSVVVGPVASNVNNHTFLLDTSTGEGTYGVTYTATDKAGNKSIPVVKTFFVDKTPPSSPASLIGVVERSMKPGWVVRSWEKSQSPDTYGYIYKSFKSYDDALNNTETINYNFMHTTVANGSDAYELGGETGFNERTFYYRVAAIDRAGNKTWSNEIHSVTVDGTPPPAPSLQINDLTNGALTNKTATAATWSKPSEDTLKYNLRYYTNIPGSSNTLATPLVTELTAEQWSGVLGEGTGQYTFQVQAIDRAGNESPWSDPFVINLDVTAPDAPALTISNEKGSVATNAITKYPALKTESNKPSDDTAKYTYQYWNDISASPWKESTPNTFESTTQIWSGDLEGGSGTYYLRVQATDAAGNTSPWSDTFVIHLDTIPPAVTVNPITPIETPSSATITAAIQDLTITKATIVITGAISGVVANAEVTVINGILTYELTTPAVDTYTVTVTAKDAAGNETTSLAQTFAVTAPVVVVPEEKPAAPVGTGSGNNTPATPVPERAADDPNPAENAVAQNTVPDAEGEVFDDTDAAQNPKPRANTFGVDGGGINDAQEIQGITDTKAFDWGFGVPWWGWLFGIATIAGGWWIIAGIRRRRQQDE